MKKTYRLKNKKRFAMFLFLLLLTALCAVTYTAAALNSPQPLRYVSVKPGDTLWEIADKYSGDTDIREYIYNIKKINGLESATIYAGQRLLIP